jgi:hypothetical protein
MKKVDGGTMRRKIIDMAAKREKPFSLTVKLSPDEYQALERFLAENRIASKQRYITFLIQHGIENNVKPEESDY